MGIYTAHDSSYGIDLYSPVETIQTEGVNVNFHTLGLEAVAEAGEFYNDIIKQIGISELRYFESNGSEIVYEGADIKAIFGKFKEFFKKLIDKVVSIFQAFIAKLRTFIGSSKSFANKYKTDFYAKWNQVRDDFEFKGFKFATGVTTLGNKNEADEFGPSDILQKIGGYVSEVEQVFSFSGNEVSLATGIRVDMGKNDRDKVDTFTKNIKSNKEDIEDGIRGFTVTGSTKGVNASTISAKEFNNELFKKYRSGEDKKVNLAKSDLSASDIISSIESEKKAHEIAKKNINAFTTAAKKCITTIEKLGSDLNTAENRQVVDNSKNVDSIVNACTAMIDVLKFAMNCQVAKSSALLQALTDEAHQNKAIVAKVIGITKKMQPKDESYSYEGIDAIVIK